MTNIKKCLLDKGFEILDEDTITVYRRKKVEVLVAFDPQHPEWAWWQVYVTHIFGSDDVESFERTPAEQSIQSGDNLLLDTFMDLGALEDPWGEAEVDK